MNDVLNVLVWREHERWLELHTRRLAERERWGDVDWDAARRFADGEWTRSPEGLYLYVAERGLREQEYRRAHERLARGRRAS